MRSGVGGCRGVRWGLAWLLLAACGGKVSRVDRAPADWAGQSGDAAGAGAEPVTGGTGGGAHPPTGGAASTDSGGAGGWPTGGHGGSGGIQPTGGADTGTGGRVTGGSGGTGGRPAGGSAGASECKEPAEIPGTKAVYDLASAQDATAGTLDFFDYPWPAFFRYPEELVRFPNPASASGCASGVTDPTLATLVSAMDPADYRAYLSELASAFLVGGPNGASVYIRFDGALDTANLPTPVESLDAATSPVLLVNVGEEAPLRGRLVPVLTRVFERSRYTKPHTLSVLPHPGFPLQPGVMHAAVVRRSLRDAEGELLGSPLAFEELKPTYECGGNAYYAQAFDFLEDTLGIQRDEIAAMTVFWAGSPTEELDHVLSEINPMGAAALASPEVTGAAVSSAGYHLVSGTFDTLVHQYGDPPYLPKLLTGDKAVALEPYSDEGRFIPAAPPTAPGGTDKAMPRTERVDFRLSLPQSVIDSGAVASPVPVVVFAAGTGKTIEDPFESGVAAQLSALGLAVFSTTPVMHAARAHSENLDPVLLALLGTEAGHFVSTIESGDFFFNPLNLQAAKGNALQSAVDYAWQAQMLKEVTFQVTLDATLYTIRFDPKRIYFFGHSQGAATGPLLAANDALSALMLSAPSGHTTTNLLGKTKPSDALGMAVMLDYLVCDDPSEPLDTHHPLLNLLFYWFESSDAQNYAPRLVREGSFRGKHVFVTAGVNDHYVALASNNAVTSAARLNQVAPELVDVPGQDLLAVMAPNWGYGVIHNGVWGNSLSPDGTAYTAAFRQYSSSCSDDHFIYSCYPQTVDDWMEFFSTLASDGTPTVPAE